MHNTKNNTTNRGDVAAHSNNKDSTNAKLINNNKQLQINFNNNNNTLVEQTKFKIQNSW